MIWRFTILNNRTNVATIVDEPNGWDANTSQIKRDLNSHGITFTSQGETFEFDGLARKLLKDEYDNYGVEGDMTLIMEEDCGNGFEEFSRGQFMFKDYEFICGDDCYVKVPIETTKENRDISNRYNQKVNLETLVAFDGITALPTYSKLPFDMELPSKGIYVKDHFKCSKFISEEFAGNQSGINNNGYNFAHHQITFGWDDNPIAEIGNVIQTPNHIADMISENIPPSGYNGPTITYYPASQNFGTAIWPLSAQYNPIINFAKDSPNYTDISNPLDLSYKLYIKIQNPKCFISNAQLFLLRLPERLNIATNGENLGDYEILNVESLNLHTYAGALNLPHEGGYLDPGNTIDFVAQYNNPNFTLNKNDRLYFFLSLNEWKNQQQINDIANGAKSFKVTLKPTSFFKLDNLTHTPSSTSKVFAVNEVISRVAEGITNDKLRGYSEYFGRTDSQPYSHAVDGCGSLEVITDGIRIRGQENRIIGKPSLFSLSLQDIFDGLNPIHNIGMGIEPDPNRVGFNRLRVEPWQYFYNNTIIMSCTDVGKLTRKMYEKEVFSTFQFGYAKWEAEQYSGLDEFLTKRTYRTRLNQIKNDLVKLSKFIASGYALEITRRLGLNNGKDWRYDKDTFIICADRIQKFRAIFNATANTIKIFTNAQTQPYFLGQTGTYIQGTQNNNGVYTIASIVAAADHVLYQITFTTLLTYEESYTTVFPNLLFPASLHVELGNVLNPQNITDPVTLYNYRISPIRIAMRWINRLFTSYKRFTPAEKIIFTDGDANYYAEGEMADPNCKLENGILVENQNIDLTIYDNPNNAKPFLTPERVSFEYPMSSRDYKNIEANPNGLIYYSSDCEDGFGWIDNIQYKPEDGKANFTLIPKAI